MLTIKTVRNSLVTDESKDSFCFRSLCSQTLSQKKLAAEMSDWNSSFTEADYLGMLSVMETVVVKYLEKATAWSFRSAFSVQMPQEPAQTFRTALHPEPETTPWAFCSVPAARPRQR